MLLTRHGNLSKSRVDRGNAEASQPGLCNQVPCLPPPQGDARLPVAVLEHGLALSMAHIPEHTTGAPRLRAGTRRDPLLLRILGR